MKHKAIYTILLLSIVLSQNLSNTQIEKLKKEFESEMKSQVQTKSTSNNENQISLNEINIDTQNENTLSSSFFGYNYFDRDLNFYDNLPAAKNYLLGPGDEIIVSMWGETNKRDTYTINREGSVYFENIGFINLSNINVSDAEKELTVRLSEIYSTLNDKENPTNLRVEINKIKSINVFFSGEIRNPGLNIIHPFSDIFTAIVQAGGINDSGSLRNIELIRNNKTILKTDFYSFFNSGLKEFQDVRIIDGDVIHIPIVKSRVQIDGDVERPNFYELLEGETLSNLINYAGGLKATASNKAITKEVTPIDNRLSDDIARVGRIINLAASKNKLLKNGSKITVLSIADNAFEVEVYGRVTYPGQYPLGKEDVLINNQVSFKSASLKDILDMAGGFDDPAFRKTIDDNIVILRLNENKFYSDEVRVNYKDAANFEMKVNDKIFVYENPNYNNSFTFNINGEINRPGTYPLVKGITLLKAIETAGGLSELGSIETVNILKKMDTINDSGELVEEFEYVTNVTSDFLISDQNTITILPITNVVKVEGNVYNPGFVAHPGGVISMSKAIELAGGYKPNSLKKRAYVVRANGEIEKANIFRGRAKRIFPGDKIFIPADLEPSEFNITDFVSNLSVTLTNIAAILILIDNQN
tara:strand:- start:8905 stop:10836 length:1932 start_codon:yes stop_codon:yes gene_type:complete